jgi:hypothetical protein
MAKSRSFFGLRRGSTKTLTFQVLNGQQITKDRVSEVRNPRTNAQLYQRAIMATILQAYSHGKRIFDHSFQGKATGSACQREFMSLNAKMLRAAVANDINNNLIEGNVTAICVKPGSSKPVPNAYIISRGSYNQNFFTWNESNKKFSFPDKQANESCATYCNRVGLVPGDIYTIVAITYNRGNTTETWPEAHQKQRECSFGFLRLMVKDSALTDSTEISSYIATLSETAGVPFVITEKYNCVSGNIVFDTEDAMGISDLGFSGNQGSIGVIRSRFDQDLRSDSVMHVANIIEPKAATGLANPYILPIWKAGTEQMGDSDLILEGGNF